MSIVFKEVEDSICKRNAFNGTSKFVWATIDPATKHHLNLPADYKYHSVFLPRKYVDWAERFQNLKVREDDVWITGYPKTGTTWLHNIVRQLKRGINVNVPTHRSSDEIFDSAIMYEHSNGNEHFQKVIDMRDKRFDKFEKMPSPRILKTHLASFLLPKEIWTTKSKVIQIIRNPKDATVSLYYMQRNTAKQFSGTLEEFCDRLMNDEAVFGPFFDYLFSFWQLRHLDHVLIVTYEQLSADLFNGIKRISEFLDCTYTDEQLKDLTEYVSFETMSKQFVDETSKDFTGPKKDADYRLV